VHRDLGLDGPIIVKLGNISVDSDTSISKVANLAESSPDNIRKTTSIYYLFITCKTTIAMIGKS
jgi:hypothetical protein